MNADAESVVRRPRRRYHEPEQRQRKLTVRFSADEEAEIQRAAAEHALTVARFIATSSLNSARNLTVADSEDRRDRALDELAVARHQVARCGNNLNQIARELNSGGLPNPADLVATLAAVRSTIAAIDVASAEIAKEK
ncbi:plasmid mobilization relaxosome protein MobC [Kitasatospora sp. NPDC059795]|uniref:plasmid mobilization protein n=1 Tax=Kitasatospora sp. NPDC059795 TaxID=3346949 RepID=UPI003650B778